MFQLHILCFALFFASGVAQSGDNGTTDAPTTQTTPTEPPTPPDGPYTVTYMVDYADRDCFMRENISNNGTFTFDYVVPEVNPIEVTLQDDITLGMTYSVQRVMEVAVDNHSDELYFRVQYTGKDTGYFVKGIGTTLSNNDCMWFLYYKDYNMPYAFLKSFGVSEFVAEPNSTVIMRYQYPPIHAVYYEVEYPHPTNCSLDNIPNPEPLVIELYFGAPNYTYTVQTVMEMAADMDPSNQFQVTYRGWRRGYEIDAINGTLNHDMCVWHFFYIPPRTLRADARNYSNISYFHVEANSTILMRFQLLEDDEVTEPPSMEIETSAVMPPIETSVAVTEPTTTTTTTSTESSPPPTVPMTTSVTLPMMSPSPSAGTKPNSNIIPLLISLLITVIVYNTF